MSEELFHLGIKGLIRNNEGKILLLKVNPAMLQGRGNYWDLPGGRVQKGQDVEETLRREIEEDTGIGKLEVVKEVGMVLSNIRIPIKEGDSVGLILGIYECPQMDGSEITLSDEHVAYDWFEPKIAAELLAVKYPKHFCELVANL